MKIRKPCVIIGLTILGAFVVMLGLSPIAFVLLQKYGGAHTGVATTLSDIRFASADLKDLPTTGPIHYAYKMGYRRRVRYLVTGTMDQATFERLTADGQWEVTPDVDWYAGAVPYEYLKVDRATFPVSTSAFAAEKKIPAPYARSTQGEILLFWFPDRGIFTVYGNRQALQGE